MKHFIFFLLMLLSFFLQAQNEKKSGKIGLSFGLAANSDSFLLGGSGTLHGEGSYSINIGYWYPISRKLEIESGISYINHAFKSSGYGGLPHDSENYMESNITNQLLSIPAGIRFSFWKYFFLNSGFLVGIDLGETSSPKKSYRVIDKQNGLGLYFGFGAKYDFKNGLGIFVAPLIRGQNIFFKEREDNLTDLGINFGVSYPLDKLLKKSKSTQ